MSISFPSLFSTDKGVRQIFTKTITANANSGTNIIGTISIQSCIIESIIIRSNASQTSNLTTCAVTGGSGVITFISNADATQTNLSTVNKQVAWTGIVELPISSTIVTNLVGTGTASVNLTFTIVYCSSSGNGGTIS